MLALTLWTAIVVRCFFTSILLFASAGTVKWIEGWILLVMISAFSFNQLIIARINPRLALERIRPGAGRPASDRALCIVLSLLFNVWIFALGFGEYPMPLWGQAVGLLLVIAAPLLSIAAQIANSFASSVVRVQHDRGQRIVTSGPYRFIRHPMYTANVLLYAGGALLAGSPAAFVVAAILTALFVIRSFMEEHLLLSAFPEYSSYQMRVRSRLIPLVW